VNGKSIGLRKISDDEFNAAFQLCVLLAERLDELIDNTAELAICRPPEGQDITIEEGAAIFARWRQLAAVDVRWWRLSDSHARVVNDGFENTRRSRVGDCQMTTGPGSARARKRVRSASAGGRQLAHSSLDRGAAHGGLASGPRTSIPSNRAAAASLLSVVARGSPS